jgi:hypothetical protein
VAPQVTIQAGRNVNFGTDPYSNVWIESQIGGGSPLAATLLSITAGQDIVTTAGSGIHIENGQNLVLTAGRDVILNTVEMIPNGTQRGSISITAANGNIVANKPLGAQLLDGAVVFQADSGINALTMSALAATGTISMQGARTQGNIDIQAGLSINSAFSLTSITGTKSLIAPSVNEGIGSAPDQQKLAGPGPASPVAAPGPTIPPPDAPNTASVGAPGLPGFPDILVAGLPGGTSGTVGLPGSPLAAILALPPTGAGESETDTTAAQRAAQLQNGNSEPGGDSSSIVVADGGIVFTGRGLQTQQENVPCPAGVAPGTPVTTKDASGKAVSVACK